MNDVAITAYLSPKDLVTCLEYMRATWTQFITPPSGLFIAAASAGVILGLTLLYVSRQRWNDPSALSDNTGNSSTSSSEFPRTYRVSPGWKVSISILYGISSLASLAGAWGFGVVAPNIRDTPQGLILVFLLVLIAAAAIFYVVDNLRLSLVLKADRLEIHEIWRVRIVHRDQVQTRQVLRPPNSPAILVLQLKGPVARRVKLPLMWATDSAWVSWFANIPDVDAEAAKSFEAAVSEDANLGATAEDRQQRLARARKLARGAIWTNAGLLTWALLYPRPYEFLVVVLVVLPWIAVWIMAQAPGIYAFNASRGSAQPDLTVLLLSPGFLLMIRAITDIHTFEWQRQMLWAVLVTIPLIVAVLWALPAARKKPGGIALTAVLLLSYGYGASELSNALLDHSSPTSYTTRVLGKHVTSGRNRTPELQLGAWGPQTASSDVAVTWDLYRTIRTGENVCVQLHPGALGVPWYLVAECPENSSP